MDGQTFTLIGATTEPGQLPASFKSRFQNRELLKAYGPAELAELTRRAAARQSIEIDPRAARELAEVSRETPRNGLNLLKRMRNEAIAAGRPRIDVGLVTRTLQKMGIDGLGLDATDRGYLEILRERPGRPLGLERLAGMLGVDAATLARDHEPYLFRLGLATTTPHGRVALN